MDEHGAASESLAAHFTVNEDARLLSAPEIVAPLDNAEVSESSVILRVFSGQDNATECMFELDTLPTFDSPALISSGNISMTAGSASWSVQGLLENMTYYWRVKTGDGAIESPWSSASFFVNVVNDPPQRPVVRNPADMAWVSGNAPELELFSFTDPDGDNVTLTFELYDDSSLSHKIMEQETSESNLQISEETGLSEYAWYFWRVKAADSHGKESGWGSVHGFFTTAAEDEKPFCADIDHDGDVDGKDLGLFVQSGDMRHIKKMAAAFGVSADLDGDGDVDGEDVAALAADPGKIDMEIFASGFGSSR